jgi:spore coat protein CotF
MQIKLNQFGDKEMITDALTSQKMITSTYNTFANECATPALRSEFMNILSDEHQIQHEIFTEMQKRGWYQVEAAEKTKIDQAKQKFAKGSSSQ